MKRTALAAAVAVLAVSTIVVLSSQSRTPTPPPDNGRQVYGGQVYDMSTEIRVMSPLEQELRGAGKSIKDGWNSTWKFITRPRWRFYRPKLPTPPMWNPREE